MAPHNQEISRGGGERDYHRLRMCVRLHIEQAQRSKNLRIQNEITERGAVTKGKGQNSFTKRKTGECFQWKTDGSCSEGQSGSFLHALAAGNREPAQEKVWSTGGSRQKHATGNGVLGRKTQEQASSSAPKVTEHTDVQCSNGRGASPETRARILCLRGAKCKRSSCCCLHPPVCVSFKSESGCRFGKRCQYRHIDAEEKPILLCVVITSLKTDAFMAIVAHTDMLDGEDKPSKRSKKEGTQGGSCYSEGK